MSHLIHIIETKQAMTKAGLTCAKKQSELLNEAFVRAVVCYRYANGATTWSEELDKRVWQQLEKWNCITPIPAQLIHTAAQQRCNEVFGAMARNGVPPDASKYGAWASLESTDMDFSLLEEFQTLVQYLKKEIGAGHE